jgi:hypothetical protein
MVEHVGSHWQRARGSAAWLAFCALAACGGGGGAATVGDVRTVTATIGAEGGTLAFPGGSHAGVALVVPPGAVAAPTTFAITAAANPQVLSLFPLYRFEPGGVELAVAASATVRVAEPLRKNGGAGAVCFQQRASGEPWCALPTQIDGSAGFATATTTRLGDIVAWNGGLHRLLTQEFALLDPAVATPVEDVAGVPVILAGGSASLNIGRGSLASFWSSPAAANVLIVPGLIGSPIDYLGPQDLIATLPPSVQNVVLLAYPTGRGVAATANWLYDEILARRQPGFGCAIVGHSMGGLVARHLLERSASDPQRAGFTPQDPSLAGIVSQLVLLGVPNTGCDLGDDLVAAMLPNVPAAERFLLQGAHDISFQPDAIALQMTGAYVDNATRYHAICGDIGGGTDGVVSVVSALALPLAQPESAWQYFVQHDDLHRLAGSNGVALRITAMLQTP